MEGETTGDKRWSVQELDPLPKQHQLLGQGYPPSKKKKRARLPVKPPPLQHLSSTSASFPPSSSSLSLSCLSARPARPTPSQSPTVTAVVTLLPPENQHSPDESSSPSLPDWCRVKTLKIQTTSQLSLTSSIHTCPIEAQAQFLN